MLILALDTTTRPGSAALWHRDRLVEVREGDPDRTHAERLPADLVALLTTHAHTLADVDIFAVVSGPGGFTGLRVGIATIQGLALVGHRPVFAASTLLLLALAAKDKGIEASAGQEGKGEDTRGQHDSSECFVGAWMHAARREVFTALYKPVDEVQAPELAGLGAEDIIAARVGLVTLDDAAVDAPEAVAARWHARHPSARLSVMGDAVSDFADPLRARFGNAVSLCSPPPLAGVLARLAAALPDVTVSPHAIVPTYVRRPDAELARDRALSRPRSDREWVGG
ncbi:MAG: tRNA (adenosine(37)-N6)-threonylcarbamoyltransferase complex dimerization subunit type 1 TsaB [Luteitalea sp.]|nr:tRNA (adenosine(37)-N6)-threonylcarbamoyltransferase complex dimerization subunit type 1 TsaB [Luteitalea sp.]